MAGNAFVAFESIWTVLLNLCFISSSRLCDGFLVMLGRLFKTTDALDG